LNISPTTEFVITLKLNNGEPHPDHQITVPERCKYCDYHNFKIWGTRIQDKISLEVRCSKCGKIVNMIVCDRQVNGLMPAQEREVAPYLLRMRILQK
jgi:hypothetical protein